MITNKVVDLNIGDVKSLSNCGFEHLSFTEKELLERPWINIFESDIESEVIENILIFSGKFPIISEGVFVAKTPKGYGAFQAKIKNSINTNLKYRIVN